MPGDLLLVVAAWYGLLSVVAFGMYGWDKRQAVRCRWRIPEARLHLVDLLGGWPGGLLARQVFRHKVRKGWFMVMSWAIVLLHVGVWVVWLVV